MILEARDLTYSYRKTSSPVLDHVSAAFDEGKFYAIVGASGSGKTTLLALLAGLDVPTQGEIFYDGADIRRTGLHRHRREHVALVFQSYNLIDYLTAEENVRLGGACDASALLAEVGLPSRDRAQKRARAQRWAAAARRHCASACKSCPRAPRRRADRQSGRNHSKRHHPSFAANGARSRKMCRRRHPQPDAGGCRRYRAAAGKRQAILSKTENPDASASGLSARTL